jgi:hypothetical protein
MILQCKEAREFIPHPEGIHPAVCVDVMDLGLVETEFQGERRMVNKVKLVFESEQKTDDGKNCYVSKNFTASLHPKAKLAEFLGKWRGRPILPGETIDLNKLIGASCTLVVSHQQNVHGRTFASIDAVSKPTKKVVPSGQYDSAAARQRFAEWSARNATAKQDPSVRTQELNRRGAETRSMPGATAATMKQAAPVAMAASPRTSPQPSAQNGEGVDFTAATLHSDTRRTSQDNFDPEVGF